MRGCPLWLAVQILLIVFCISAERWGWALLVMLVLGVNLGVKLADRTARRWSGRP